MKEEPGVRIQDPGGIGSLKATDGTTFFGLVASWGQGLWPLINDRFRERALLPAMTANPGLLAPGSFPRTPFQNSPPKYTLSPNSAITVALANMAVRAPARSLV